MTLTPILPTGVVSLCKQSRKDKLIINSLTSSQFSHKQLVLVTAPVSTGAYFFVPALQDADQKRVVWTQDGMEPGTG